MNRMIPTVRLVIAVTSAALLFVGVGCDEGPDPFAQGSGQSKQSRDRMSAESSPPIEAAPAELPPEPKTRPAPNKEHPSMVRRSDTQHGQEPAVAKIQENERRPARPESKQSVQQPPHIGSAGRIEASHGPARAVDPSGTSTTLTQPAFSVKLSAGVALPQSLPTGTTMGFSVDYVFQRGQPSPRMKVVWVIEGARGGKAEIPVHLRARGSLSTFVPGAKPQHGPFQCYLVLVSTSGQRQPISSRVAMK